MSIPLLTLIVGVAAVAGAASYLSAYAQIAHSHVAADARRRALAAVPGPFVFYSLLGVLLRVAAPLMFPR